MHSVFKDLRFSLYRWPIASQLIVLSGSLTHSALAHVYSPYLYACSAVFYSDFVLQIAPDRGLRRLGLLHPT